MGHPSRKPVNGFKPGQSGNPGGKVNSKAISEALRIVAGEPCPVAKKKKARVLAEKMFEKAMDGDVQAATFVADRLEGKPVQQQILSGDPDAPLQTVSTQPLSPADWAAKYGAAANQD